MERTRDRLLRAAGAVIRRDGLRALTLEAVAAEAGVSKGGLLYHFRSKRDLVTAMGEARAAEMLNHLRQHWADHPADGACGAYLALDAMPRSELDTALLAGALEKADLGSFRQALAALQHAIDTDAADPLLGTVVRLASDGLWFADLLGVTVLTADQRAAVVARLAELAREATGTPGPETASTPTGEET